MNPSQHNSPTLELHETQASRGGRIPRIRIYGLLTLASCVLGLVALQWDFHMADQKNLDWMPGDLRRVFDLSELFAHGFGLFVFAVGIWVLVPDKRRFIPRIAVCALTPALMVCIAKLFVSRARPVAYLQPDQTLKLPESVTTTWHGLLPDQSLNVAYLSQSFPSAHTATAVGFAIGMSWVFPKGRIFFFSLALLASLQRITSLAHWSSDVCVGAAFAFCAAAMLCHRWSVGTWLLWFENRDSPKLTLVEEQESEETPRIAA